MLALVNVLRCIHISKIYMDVYILSKLTPIPSRQHVLYVLSNVARCSGHVPIIIRYVEMSNLDLYNSKDDILTHPYDINIVHLLRVT